MKKSLKMLTLGMAGFVFSAQLAYADVVPTGPVTAVPISAVLPVASSVKITTKTIKSEGAELNVDIAYPVVAGMKDTGYQAELNDKIAKMAEAELENAKKEAHESAVKLQAAGFTVHPYQLIIQTAVKQDGGAANKDRISFAVTTYLATGGTGNPRVDTYNIVDAEKAKVLTLEELLGADYKAIVDKEVNVQIAANPALYMKDAFKGISEAQAFYVEGSDVVIVFPKYSIAPGSTGTPEFRITLPSEAKPADGVKMTTKEINTTSPELNVKVSIPVLTGAKDEKYQGQLNDIIERQAMEDLDNAKKSALEAAAKAKEAGFEMHPYELIVKGELKSNGGAANDDRVSISVTTYLATGGTGNPVIANFSFKDTAVATPLTLDGLLGPDYISIVDKAVKEGMAAAPEKYFPDSFKGIRDSQSFYVQGQEIVIVFPKYEIAPGSTGTPEFRIPIAADGGATKPADPAVVLKAAQTFKNESGTTMVQLRLAAESLGFQLTWNEANRSVDLIKGVQFTTVYEGKDAYFRNKMAPMSLGGAAVNKEGTMFVPLAFITDILQGQITIQ